MEACTRTGTGSPSSQVALHQGDVVHVVGGLVEADGLEGAEARVQGHFPRAFHEAFVFQAVRNQIGNGHQLHVVFLRQLNEFRQTCHGAILVHDFHDDTGWLKSSKAREIHRRFGVSWAAQHAAGFGPQGEDVSGSTQLLGLGERIDQGLDGFGAVAGGDAGGAAMANQIHRHGERSFERGVVAFDHQAEVQFVASGLEKRRANQASSMGGHEVDHFWRCVPRGDQKVPFVFSILVVDHDDDFTLANGFNGLRNAVEFGHGSKVLVLVPVLRTEPIFVT